MDGVALLLPLLLLLLLLSSLRETQRGDREDKGNRSALSLSLAHSQHVREREWIGLRERRVTQRECR